jgi:hypothetical protein
MGEDNDRKKRIGPRAYKGRCDSPTACDRQIDDDNETEREPVKTHLVFAVATTAQQCG